MAPAAMIAGVAAASSVAAQFSSQSQHGSGHGTSGGWSGLHSVISSVAMLGCGLSLTASSAMAEAASPAPAAGGAAVPAPLTGAFQLPQLPFELDALEPYMGASTLAVHWGKHHRCARARVCVWGGGGQVRQARNSSTRA